MSKNNEFSDLIDCVNASHLPYKEHNLLLTDLCGRLLYGVKCALYSKYFSHPKMGQVVRIDARMEHIIVLEENFDMPVTYGTWQVKPYLRPLEDMTEEEKEELRDLCWFGIPSDDYDEYDHKGVEVVSYIWNKRNDFSFDFDDFNALLDWLNKKHFDYRGLIPKGLAIKVTPDNNPY